MDYNYLISGMKKYGSSEEDICLHGLGISPDLVDENVILAPWWEPSSLPKLGEVEYLTESRLPAVKVWNIKNNDLSITYIKTGIGAPVLMDALLALGVTRCKRVIFKAMIFSVKNLTLIKPCLTLYIPAQNESVITGTFIFIVEQPLVLILFLHNFLILMKFPPWVVMLLKWNMDRIIYGMIINYIFALAVDKVMYGINAGKLTLIVTDKGPEIAQATDKASGRETTIIKAKGGYQQDHRDVVMCACSTKEMHLVEQAVKKVDPAAFTVIMESNELLGEGFKTLA